jgi:hypothetical protein
VKAADGKQTVEQMLKAANTTVKGFTLYVVGEGIEKKVDDFAAEVAAQVAAAKGAACHRGASRAARPLFSSPFGESLPMSNEAPAHSSASCSSCLVKP